MTAVDPFSAPGVRWTWTPDVWRWTPDRDSPADRVGWPRQVVHWKVDTSQRQPHEQYDFWCQTTYFDFDTRRSSETQRRGFAAAMTSLVGPRGLFYASACDGLAGTSRPQAGGPGDITVGLMLEGERRYETASGSGTTGPGGFFAYDGGRHSAVALTRHRCLSLTIRRPEMEAVMGPAVPAVDILARALDSSGLRPFLITQLTLLQQHSERLSDAERAAGLDNTLDLALLVLRTAIGTAVVPASLRKRALFTAAGHYIERHCHKPALDADEIARAIGCSRMTLYRVFAEQDLTIGDAIRQVRLQRAAEMLTRRPVTMTVEQVARCCGIVSLRTFYRQFRQAFDMTPDEMRTAQPRRM